MIWFGETKNTEYIGEWQRDNISGQGTMTWKDGATYEGKWTNGVRNGKGK